MRTAVSAVLFSTLFFRTIAPGAETLPWNIPEQINDAIRDPRFNAFAIGDWLNPFYLRGDFDGDSKVDYAVLVTRKSDQKKGIAIWLSSKREAAPIMIGAGVKARAGSGDSDNWDFFDAWQVYGKKKVGRGADEGTPARLIGEAIVIEKTESASGLLYWDGKSFRWYQQGD